MLCTALCSNWWTEGAVVKRMNDIGLVLAGADRCHHHYHYYERTLLKCHRIEEQMARN